MKIGLFDSGLGGLNVLAEFRRQLPQYDYIYFGDHAHAPFGDKEKQKVKKITVNGIKFLKNRGAQLIILACNTATAASLRPLQRHYVPKHSPGLKILGIIRPTTELILEKNWQEIGIMATQTTVGSSIFEQELKKFNWQGELFPLACPQLVPLIENGLIQSDKMKKVLANYLRFFQRHSLETLILGCTHYSLLKKVIKAYLPQITVIAEEEVAAPKLQQYLRDHRELEKQLTQSNSCQCFFTFQEEKNYARYYKMAKKIMPDGQFRKCENTIS